MRVQEVYLPNSTRRYVVVDENGALVVPVARYLKYLDKTDRARNTLRSYAYALRLYFEYLQRKDLDFLSVTPDDMAGFVLWLKNPYRSTDLLPRQPAEQARANSTVNQTLTAVTGLYDYLWRRGEISYNLNEQLTRVLPVGAARFRSYKGFLHHAARNVQVRANVLRQKVPKQRPKTVTKQQVEALVGACNNPRDRLLLALLYESSLRIGEALALWIEDIDIPRMKLHVRDRGELENGAEIKTPAACRSVDVSRELINLLMDYLAVFHTDEVETNHVFIKLHGPHRGQPMTYSDVNNLFIRLRSATGIDATPHVLRHSSLTALSRADW